MTLYTQSELSKNLGISRQAVSKLIKRGTVCSRADGKIDTENLQNKDYILRHKQKNELKKVAIENKKDPGLSFESAGQKEAETSLPADLSFKSGVDLEKAREQLRRLQIQNEKELKLLIDRTIVQRYFGKISSVIVNYFFPMGGRLAPIVAGVCDSNNPEQIAKVKSEIDREISRSLDQFKKECDDILKDMEADL